MGNKIFYKGYNVGETTQVSIMPTATADNSGAIVQYVGATNANYINGYFYKCVSDGGVTPAYSWEKMQVSDDGDTIQVETLPTAGASEVGNIYQYVGETNLSFTNGYFYKCVSDGEDPATYSWVNIPVQDVPTALSELTNDTEFIDNTVNDLVNYTTTTDLNTALDDKADKATTLAGYGITDAYTKTEVDTKVSSVYRYKGSVQTYADLPSSDQVIGDVYNIETADPTHSISAGDNVAWNGTTWDKLGGDIDLSDYYTKTQTDTLLDDKADKATTLAGYGITDAYTKTEVDTKVSSVYRYKGSVQTYADLPSSDQVIGDVYNIETADPTHSISAGDNVAWNGTTWDKLGGDIDLSDYYTKTQTDTLLDDKVDKVTGKGLSTEDYTTAEKTKLAGLSNYTLPSATQNALGGIKIWVDSANNLQISTQ